MNESKIIAAILPIAVSARASRASSLKVGKESWRRVIEDYKQILAELDPDSDKESALEKQSGLPLS